MAPSGSCMHAHAARLVVTHLGDLRLKPGLGLRRGLHAHRGSAAHIIDEAAGGISGISPNQALHACVLPPVVGRQRDSSSARPGGRAGGCMRRLTCEQGRAVVAPAAAAASGGGGLAEAAVARDVAHLIALVAPAGMPCHAMPYGMMGAWEAKETSGLQAASPCVHEHKQGEVQRHCTEPCTAPWWHGAMVARQLMRHVCMECFRPALPPAHMHELA